ncbi:hypothetical protein A4A49_06125 [Nicotiana attenuata]|uniref:Uncharacterized protein n=1 Tax=Nicotiana attenuata TaxID=49451 RepID=A0A314KY37_NICAT|nr:hypothetical protein A4A49_06125 [Nicotiana attenuata]
MFDKMSYGYCSKVFDTDQSDVKVISDTTTSTLNIAKSEEVHVFDGSSHRSKSESVSTFEIGQSVDDNSSITTANPSILDLLIRMADVENSTTTIDKVINDNFRESDSLLQPSCDALQTEVTAATFDNTIGISLDFVPMTSLVVSIGYSQHVTPSLVSKHEEEGNARNNVAREFENSPIEDKTSYRIPFASQGSVVSNAIGRFVGIAYPFIGASQNILWRHYDFGLHKYNWVATGQHDSLLLTAKRRKGYHIYSEHSTDASDTGLPICSYVDKWFDTGHEFKVASGRVEIGVEHNGRVINSTIYKLWGESIANLFVCSFDDATTQIEEQYLIDQLRSFYSGRALELSELYQALTFTMALWVNETVIIRDEPLQGVAAITRKPPLGINSIFSIPRDMAMFDIHGKMMLNASMRTTEVEYPFDGALCLRTIPFLRNSLEVILVDKQIGVSLSLEFSDHNCNWVDMGQERNLFEFWLSKSRKRAREKKIRGMLRAFAEDYSKQYIVFDPGPYLDYAAPNTVESTFEDEKSTDVGALKVRFALLHEKFRIGQVLPLQSGITLDDCHRFKTYDCCHIGACTYYHLESDVVLSIVLFCTSLDNWLDTGQNKLGFASIAKEHLNIASDAVEMLDPNSIWMFQMSCR